METLETEEKKYSRPQTHLREQTAHTDSQTTPGGVKKKPNGSRQTNAKER